MRLGMTLGLIGGGLALLFGIILALIGNAIGGAASQLGATGTAARSMLLIVVSIGLPVMAIVGSIMLPKSTSMALVLMGVSGAVMLLFGVTSQAWIVAIMGALILAGAYFGWSESKTTGTASDDGA